MPKNAHIKKTRICVSEDSRSVLSLETADAGYQRGKFTSETKTFVAVHTESEVSWWLNWDRVSLFLVLPSHTEAFELLFHLWQCFEMPDYKKCIKSLYQSIHAPQYRICFSPQTISQSSRAVLTYLIFPHVSIFCCILFWFLSNF